MKLIKSNKLISCSLHAFISFSFIFFPAAAQQQLALVTEKERSAVDFAMEMKSRVSGLELQIKTLRQQKEEITNELEKVKEKSKVLESDLMK